jgi:hypothetical protein
MLIGKEIQLRSKKGGQTSQVSKEDSTRVVRHVQKKREIQKGSSKSQRYD